MTETKKISLVERIKENPLKVSAPGEIGKMISDIHNVSPNCRRLVIATDLVASAAIYCGYIYGSYKLAQIIF